MDPRLKEQVVSGERTRQWQGDPDPGRGTVDSGLQPGTSPTSHSLGRARSARTMSRGAGRAPRMNPGSRCPWRSSPPLPGADAIYPSIVQATSGQLEGRTSELPALPSACASRPHRSSGLGGAVPIRTPRNLAERVTKTLGTRKHHRQLSKVLWTIGGPVWHPRLRLARHAHRVRTPIGAGSATINI